MAKNSPKTKAKPAAKAVRKKAAARPPAARKAPPASPPPFTLPRAIADAHARATALAPPLPMVPDGAVLSYKGFNAKLQCNDYQFEIGASFHHSGPVAACRSGFHACPAEHHPLTVFGYYQPAGSRYAHVFQSGAMDPRDGDKIASASITIHAEISLPQLIASAIRWVHDRVNWKDAVHCTGDNEGALNQARNGAATASGYQGAATASGDQGAATASGVRGAATASGVRGAATASGVRGAATASGDQGAATASGDQGAATASGVRGAGMSSGCGGKVRGVEGTALFLVYRSAWDGPVEKVWAGIAGQGGIKPDTFYRLAADGVPVEVV
jgi:hypothetical protein